MDNTDMALSTYDLDGEGFLGGDKMIFDPIHGLVQLEKPLVAIIDTPQFQRLRDLSQLGTSYYVFPGATHKRFEHSIGVAHLAGKQLSTIQKRQPELQLRDHDILLVKMAGLCHDLGHGPFSHVFDGEFIRRVRPDMGWHHEKGSLMMLEALLEENNIEMEKNDIRTVKNYIDAGSGLPDSQDGRKLEFLYDVVANGKNGIDVDKFDYLRRDCQNIGLKSSYDGARLIEMCRVIDDQICYHQKEAYNIYQLFHTRYSLHKNVYSHRVSKAIEYMICDALVEADSVLGISSSIDDASSYLHLTDSIISTIASSPDPRLAKSQQIIKDLRCRRIYRLAHERVLTRDEAVYFPKNAKITACEVVSYQHDSNLTPDDIIIQQFQLGYSMRDKNPVEIVRFFSGANPNQSFKIGRTEVSLMVPEQFTETILRVFVRRPTHEKLAAAKRALVNFINSRLSKTNHREGTAHQFAVPVSPAGAVTPSVPTKKQRVGAPTSSPVPYSMMGIGISPCPTPPKRRRRPEQDTNNSKGGCEENAGSSAATTPPVIRLEAEFRRHRTQQTQHQPHDPTDPFGINSSVSDS